MPATPSTDLVDQVVAEVRKHADGATRSQVRSSVSGRTTAVLAAIDVAVASGRIFMGTGYVRARGGSLRTTPMLFARYAKQPSGSLGAAELVKRRRRSGLSQAALARELGVSPALVKAWELDRQPVPPLAIARIDDVLGRAPEIIEEERRRRGDDIEVPSGPELKAMRERAGWSREEVGMRLGRAKSTVQAWELGSRVPGGVRSALLEMLTQEGPRSPDARDRSLLELIAAEPGITTHRLTERWGRPGQLGKSRGRGSGPNGVGGDALTAKRLDALTAAGRVHRAPAPWHGQSVVGWFVGPPTTPPPGLSGDELGSLRRAAGLSRPALARQMGVSGTLVQSWESGRKPVPAARAEQIRELLASVPVSKAPYQDRSRRIPEAERRRAILAAVVRRPGLTTRQLVDELQGDRAIAREMVAALLAEGSLRSAPVRRRALQNATRPVDGLFLS